MRDSWWSVAFIVGFVALISYAIYPRRRNQAQLLEWRAAEERDLTQLCIEVSDARHSVDGGDCTTVERTEEVQSLESGHIVSFLATRFLRNPEGEYFLWMWRPHEKPYVKHMPQANARVVLKRKYIPPEGGS